MKTRFIAALCLLNGCNAIDPLIADAQEAARRQLGDESARFENVERCSNDWNMVRGEVAWRNTHGNFDFEPFFYADGKVAMSHLDGRAFEALLPRCFR